MGPRPSLFHAAARSWTAPPPSLSRSLLLMMMLMGLSIAWGMVPTVGLSIACGVVWAVVVGADGSGHRVWHGVGCHVKEL